MTELQNLLRDLQNPAIALELLGLLVCLAAAWAISWVLWRKRSQSSGAVLLGTRLFDGVLLPTLAATFVFVLRQVLLKTQSTPLLKVALPVLVSWVLIRWIQRVLAAVFPQSRRVDVLVQMVSWLAWGLAVLWATGLWEPFVAELDSWQFTFGKKHISVMHVLEVVATFCFVWVLMLWLSAALEARVLKPAFTDLSMRKVAGNALRVLLLVSGALFALSSMGVDLTTFSVLGGAVGVGIGFGLQKLAANYISGFVILLERSLRIGDLVRVDGFEGRVSDIKTRYTLVRASNGSESVVPNELLLTQRVENMSLESRHLLQSCTFWVALDSDVERVQTLLVQAAQGTEWVMAEPAPQALLGEVAPQGLRFNLSFWMEDPANGQSLTRSRVNITALKTLRSAGVRLVEAA